METLIIEIDSENIDEGKLEDGGKILRNGGIVAFPTETVYGLGGNALDVAAVEKIFIAKGRPSDNPLIVHIAKLEDITPLVKNVSEEAWKVMEYFWPGPLTLVLEKSDLVPEIITGGLSTVAIRMPSHPIAKRLIEIAGVPVAAPSANISGKPSPTREEHVLKDLNGKVDAIILGGSCDVGLESTVVDMTSEIPLILRPGGLTRERLLEVLPRLDMDMGLGGEDMPVPKSPGMKYTHYAPRARVYIIQGDRGKTIEKIKQLRKDYSEKGKKVGIICFDETFNKYSGSIVKSMGTRADMKTIAANLFKVLRDFDETDVDIILAEAIEEKELGQAIMNRMIKAAGHRILKV